MKKHFAYDMITGIVLSIFWLCILLRFFAGIRLISFEFLRIIFFFGIIYIIFTFSICKYHSQMIIRKIVRVNLSILGFSLILSLIPMLGYMLFWKPVGVITGYYRTVLYEDQFRVFEKEDIVVMSGGQHEYITYSKHGLYDKIIKTHMLFDRDVDNKIEKLKNKKR